MKKMIFLLGLSISFSVQASTATQRLKSFYAEIKTLQAQFQQTLQDSKKKILEKSTGKFMLKRPGQFRWEYQQPFPQLLVSNAKTVWIYDEDLEQVTIKKTRDTIGSTPAALLSNGKNLEKQFEIKELGNKENLDWLELKPKNKDTSFEKINLAFDVQGLHTMELIDKLGQTTRLIFTELKKNAQLPDSLFRFDPPPGIEINSDG